jgi:hypothetical protein
MNKFLKLQALITQTAYRIIQWEVTQADLCLTNILLREVTKSQMKGIEECLARDLRWSPKAR